MFSETFVDSEKVSNVKSFLHFQPAVGTHFHSKVKKDEEGDNLERGVESESAEDKQTTMFEMHRKTLSKALLTHEVIEEINERKMTHKFGPKLENGVHKSVQETQSEFMKHVDYLRSHETYSHESCSKGCSDRGCRWVYVIDGNWKLREAIL